MPKVGCVSPPERGGGRRERTISTSEVTIWRPEKRSPISSDLAEAWSGLGYYSRARRLHEVWRAVWRSGFDGVGSEQSRGLST